jgi:histidine triad (HIT) family protein
MSGAPSYLDACAFCKIARGLDTRPEIVAEGDEWLAFFPLEPATPGHTLVVPRTHVEDFWSAPESLVSELTAAAGQVGRAIQSALSPEGLNLITSAGEAAEQTIFHLHLHLVPRRAGDGFGHIWPSDGSTQGSSLRPVASRIRRAWGESH